MRIIVFLVLATIPPLLIGALVLEGREAAVAAPTTKTSTARAAADDPYSLLRALFAPPPAGMIIKEKLALYDDKGLFDYIDGAAPIFIERHFRKLAASEMATPAGSEFVCDVYDMASAENAQSIFDKEKSATAKPLDGWPEAIAGPMSLVFHHGRYYAKLTAFDAKAEAALPSVARALKEKMQ